MLASFDPIGDRKFWLEFKLKTMKFAPQEFSREAQPTYLHTLVNSSVDAFLLGLADHVRPLLEATIRWIESHDEPDLREYSKERHHWRYGWDSRFAWYQTLGLCKWLSRGDAAAIDFAKAMKAEADAWEYAIKEDIVVDHGEEQQLLTERMATALAANHPGMGLKLFAAVDIAEPSELEVPLLQFGQWACQHLVDGGKRDVNFVARGAEMLRATLLPNFFWGANRTEPALWLKAIYWDSGVARTPEQAIAKAYDSMPGIERPDFVPR
jgi:hypothetical protein